jgi:subfamily B ATP-binding cassette protein MsbA
VTFSYKNNINVLNKVNFDMKYGEVTAIVGISGSGKSTITKLIERLYDVTDGKILIDSHDIKKYSLKSLRNNIGLVSQDIELIDGTIYENIIYGQPNKSDKEVIKAIEAANLVEFINNLPKGVETEVGEKGIKLSGGQKQRIAIARIFLKNAPVLILDEATASLDNESERYIQESLDQLLEKRTSIVIAHRLSTIQKADQILVLDQGMIVEKGTHEELLNKNKRYRKLYDAQFS